MTCTPYHQKPPQIDPRAVRRIHKWKFGHDPADPDTHEDSGWVYATIEPSTPSEPNQRYLLSGGEDSGFPCTNCQTMTKIAGEKTLKWMLEQKGVDLANPDDVDWKRAEETVILILACPKCEQLFQFFREFVPKVMRHE